MKTSRKLPAVLIISAGIIASSVTACSNNPQIERARQLSAKSDSDYKEAIKIYNGLIKSSREAVQLRMELGKLYFRHGDFEEAAKQFRASKSKEAEKLLAISYYKMGRFSDALDIFGGIDPKDEETSFYYGQNCEKLNLFDQAIEAYTAIKGSAWAQSAKDRLNFIERSSSEKKIKEVNAEVESVIRNAPGQENYPQAGALVLKSEDLVRLKEDNKQVISQHAIIKILNERGKEEFSETRVEYDSTFERVELEYARTITPDGRVIEVGSRHIRDVSKYLNFPLYSNARVFIISFPEIAELACIEYKLKIYNNELINKKDFIVSFPLQCQEPIISSKFVLEVPKRMNIRLKNINESYNNFGANLSPEIKEGTDTRIYKWEFKDVPQILPESGMPPQSEVNPSILISSFSDWGQIYAWWHGLSKDRIYADTDIKNKVKELLKTSATDESKISSIYNYCAQKIRYVAVEYGKAGYQPHKASDIFRYKYGDCKDKAILLITMLKEAGFRAYPVLIPTKGVYNLDEAFPALFFNHCIACVETGDKLVFMDPTAETCAFGDLPESDQERRVILIKDTDYQIAQTPLFGAEHNLLRHVFKLKINKDGTINGEKSVFTFGVYDQAQRFWLLYTAPQLVEHALNEKIQSISIGAKLTTYNVKNLDRLDEPVVLKYAFTGPEYLTQAGSLKITPQLVSVDSSLTALNSRIYPIDFGMLDSKYTVYELELPDNLMVKYLPEDISRDSPWLKFETSYRKEGNVIKFTQRTELKKNYIGTGEYTGFKALFEEIAKKIKQRIVLEEKSK